MLLLALLATVVKLILAATTFGTNDVHYWIAFAAGAKEFGPVGMYVNPEYGSAPYNHAPLTGHMLVWLNWLDSVTGKGIPFLIRMIPSVADTVTAVVIFELVRQERPVKVAAVCAILAAWGPVMLIVSGFHGNTDPLMMMFALLAVLLATKGWFGWSGVSAALALSVKLIPVIILPLLIVVAIRAGWKAVARLAAGGALVFLVLWVPVLWGHGQQFMASVVGYKGIGVREWGIYQFALWAELDEGVKTAFVDHGRFVVLALAAFASAWFVWRRPGAVVPATGLAFAGFLLFSSAFSMQYLVWPALAVYLVSPWLGALFNVAAGAFAISVYNSWNGDLHLWQWNEGRAHMFEPRHFVFMVIAWVTLAMLVTSGVAGQFRTRSGGVQPGGKANAGTAAPSGHMIGVSS